MKRRLTWVLLLVSLWAVQAAVAEMRIVYRGRLTSSVSGTVVTTPHDVSFNLYADEKDGSPLWGMKAKVTPDANGNIVQSLADGFTDATYLVPGAVLTNVIHSSKALYLGLTVESAREISPRQPLLARPTVARARRAERLLPNGTARMLETVSLSADNLNVGSKATVTEKFGGTDGGAAGQSFVLNVDDLSKVNIKGKAAYQSWGNWKRIGTIGAADTSFLATYTGIYYITSLSAMANFSSEQMIKAEVNINESGWWAPGLVFFGKVGVTYPLPYLGSNGADIWCRPFEGQ